MTVSHGEDVNPMGYLTNLADAMLVLAVGIMVALVLHWNVPLQSVEMQDDADQMVTFTQDELSGAEKVPENAVRAGDTYYDAETDSYYFVQSPDQTDGNDSDNE